MKLSLKWPRARAALEGFFAWRWGKPLARVALAVGALVVLALVGNATLAGAAAPLEAARAVREPDAPTEKATILPEPSPPVPAASPPDVAADRPPPPPATASASAGGVGAADPVRADGPHRGPATPEDPVVLNTASLEDLQRLPGIGAKRASAILTLRGKLGRFRQIEDLLRVRGIGPKTLRRLRPLLRVDPPAAPDAGA